MKMVSKMKRRRRQFLACLHIFITSSTALSIFIINMDEGKNEDKGK